jgi:hypothetical protein
MVGTHAMQQQVTDVMAPRRQASGARSRLPLWLKIAWTLWVLLWAPLYFKQYGAQNFLFFCDLGNLLIAIALWRESRLIFSFEAVGLLVFQTLYVVDLLGALLSGKHAFGGTEYMFDPHISLLIRLMGLYHCVVPPLLLWAVRRLGYDQRGWKWQTALTAIVVPINFFWRPAYNVNFARGIGHPQHTFPGWLYLIAYLIIVPLVIYWPTHLALKWWGREGEQPTR